ncbi:DUF6460 domain-containing protein [Gimibacter soli]|uniref:DUF6460 domain-containing protein n=1 Tax=Gimibacter soli TaxID=3024400 RepID=A0AAF0BLW3_9PROT|nr:DUF6460 domain-containing protein [Gimibacter soli]WCL54647.1 DUF6460 domain-containing protein [Gimibacter soli]
MSAGSKVDVGLIVKLAVWSLIVGAILYWLDLSPGDVYSWVGDKLNGLWQWTVGNGLNYMLLGATIVVPVYILLRLKAGLKRPPKS